MSLRESGVYNFVSVTIPEGVVITFKPNAKNTPVVWLIKESCTIAGTVELSGKPAEGPVGGAGGPGGGRGGNGGTVPESGVGLGGGIGGGSGSFATVGFNYGSINPPAPYGTTFLVPLLGGSGGGATGGWGGAGAGGALLIVANSIKLTGSIRADGASGSYGEAFWDAGGAGSGGAVRLVCNRLSGSGTVGTAPGGFFMRVGWGAAYSGAAGKGRIRFDAKDNSFSGSVNGDFSAGYQPIVFPAKVGGVSLTITKVGGLELPTVTGGNVNNPDVILPSRKARTMGIVVRCSQIPLNTAITVKARMSDGTVYEASGLNSSGTIDTSFAVVEVPLERGRGVLYATCVVPLAAGAATASLDHGLSALGESFVALEVSTEAGGGQHLAYLTASGRRYPLN